MDSVDIDDAAACLDELIDRVEAGFSIEITRDGKPVARLIPSIAPRKPIDIAALRELTVGMAPQGQPAADIAR